MRGVGARGYPPLPRHPIRAFRFTTRNTRHRFRVFSVVLQLSSIGPDGHQCTISKTRRRADGYSRARVHPRAPLPRQWCTVHSAPIIVPLNNTVHRAPYYIYRDVFKSRNPGTRTNNVRSAPSDGARCTESTSGLIVDRECPRVQGGRDLPKTFRTFLLAMVPPVP